VAGHLWLPSYFAESVGDASTTSSAAMTETHRLSADGPMPRLRQEQLSLPAVNGREPLPQHLKVHVRDVEHLEQVIDRFTPFGVTTTSIMQSSPVPGRGPALPGRG
jgi:hypothetical protein